MPASKKAAIGICPNRQNVLDIIGLSFPTHCGCVLVFSDGEEIVRPESRIIACFCTLSLSISLSVCVFVMPKIWFGAFASALLEKNLLYLWPLFDLEEAGAGQPDREGVDEALVC